jgi:hypothetical protein
MIAICDPSSPPRTPGGAAPDCPRCGGYLTLHQPDPQRPRRLLGACCECGGWCLVEEPARVPVPLSAWDPPVGVRAGARAGRPPGIGRLAR